MKVILSIQLFFLSLSLSAQEEGIENKRLIERINSLEKEVLYLKEVQNESNLAIRGMFKDSFLGKKSKGFISLGYGLSQFSPDDIEEDNRISFESVNATSTWDNYSVGHFFEIEIGKKLLLNNSNYLNLSIGFQHWQSETIEGEILSTSSSSYSFEQKVEAQSIFLRTSFLNTFKIDHLLGLGLTLGYTPNAEIDYSISQGQSGVTVSAEGEGALFEAFGVYEYSFSNDFSISFKGGYRINEISNVQLNVADIINQNSTLDIEMSGLFTGISLSMNL